MAISQDLIDALNSDQQQPTTQSELPPVVQMLVAEIGEDAILAEATLDWVRIKKREIAGAILQTVYMPSQLEEKIKKLE